MTTSTPTPTNATPAEHETLKEQIAKAVADGKISVLPTVAAKGAKTTAAAPKTPPKAKPTPAPKPTPVVSGKASVKPAPKAKATTTPAPLPAGTLSPKQAEVALKKSAKEIRAAARVIFKDSHDATQRWAFTPEMIEQLKAHFKS